MKLKYLFAVSFALFISTFFTFPTLAANSISVVVDNNPVVFDTPPFIENGRILVPLRAIAEAAGMKVSVVDSKGNSIVLGMDVTEMQQNLGDPVFAWGRGVPSPQTRYEYGENMSSTADIGNAYAEIGCTLGKVTVICLGPAKTQPSQNPYYILLNIMYQDKVNMPIVDV